MDLVKKISENIEIKRLEQKISVDKLSKKADISLSALNKLRKGNIKYIRVDTLYALANAFNCTMDELTKE